MHDNGFYISIAMISRRNYYDHPINVLGNIFGSNEKSINHLINVLGSMFEFDGIASFLASMPISIRIDDDRLRSRELLRFAIPLFDATLAQVSLV